MKYLAAATTLAAALAIATPSLACKGRSVTKTGPNGKTITVCLDGKKSSCLRDSRRLGHSQQAAADYCGSKNLR